MISYQLQLIRYDLKRLSLLSVIHSLHDTDSPKRIAIHHNSRKNSKKRDMIISCKMYESLVIRVLGSSLVWIGYWIRVVRRGVEIRLHSSLLYSVSEPMMHFSESLQKISRKISELLSKNSKQRKSLFSSQE